MPLTGKGTEILHEMQKEYGQEKGKSVFYASRNAGKISGVDAAEPAPPASGYTAALPASLIEDISPVPIRAAGILFCHKGTALFLQRSLTGDHAGEWCFPGGGIEEGEDAATAAVREAKEETGYLPGVAGKLHTRRVADGVDFTTFMQEVDEPFAPVLNGEHIGYAWAPIDAPPEPLHPGCRVALARLGMDELGIARAMAAGELTSPQRYHNVTLYCIRITGTGVSYRPKHDEFVYRRPENYLTEDFLARCNGLSVIWQHPKDSLLNSEEYAARTVGAVMLPYILGDEVWAVVRIYDDETIRTLESDRMSTSPAVLLDKAGSQNVTLEDGSKLLIEGKPTLLDHICLTPRGVWDKGEEATGVEQANLADVVAMADSVEVVDRRAGKLDRVVHSFAMARQDVSMLVARQMRQSRASRR